MTRDPAQRPGRLFVTQALLQAWAGERRVRVDAAGLHVAGGPGVPPGGSRTFPLEPAVRFLRVDGDGEDPHGLLGRVESFARVQALGGQPSGPLLVFGPVAYVVEAGYLADATGVAAAARAEPQAAVADAPRAEPQPDVADAAPDVAELPIVPAEEVAPAPRPLPPELEERREDAEALARFLLDNLP